MTDQSSANNAAAETSINAKASNKKVLIIVAIVVGALIIFGIISSLIVGGLISKSTKQAAERGLEAISGGQVSVDKNSGKDTYTFTSKEDGSKVQVGSNVSIPDGFPKDIFPIYKNAVLVSSSNHSKDNSGRTYTVLFSTKDSSSQVSEFYKNVFTQNGWEATSTNEGPKTTFMTSKNTTHNMNGGVTIMVNDKNETSVSLMADTKAN